MLQASLKKCNKSLQVIDFDNDFISTMKNLERSFWDYIDTSPNIKQKFTNGICFGGSLTHNFIKNILIQNNQHAHIQNIREYIKTYNKYNKSRLTAGVVLRYQDSFIVVQTNNGIDIWGMPKGKQEEHENIVSTACREFYEETGIDVSGFIDEETENHKIHKTVFYMLETEIKVDVSNYKNNEISGVKWVKFREVLDNEKLYSKQVFKIAQMFCSLKF